MAPQSRSEAFQTGPCHARFCANATAERVFGARAAHGLRKALAHSVREGSKGVGRVSRIRNPKP